MLPIRLADLVFVAACLILFGLILAPVAYQMVAEPCPPLPPGWIDCPLPHSIP